MDIKVMHVHYKNSKSIEMLEILSASQYHLQKKQALLVSWYIRDPMDCSSPDSSVDRIFHVRILELVAIPFSRYLSYPGIQPGVSCIEGRCFII